MPEPRYGTFGPNIPLHMRSRCPMTIPISGFLSEIDPRIANNTHCSKSQVKKNFDSNGNHMFLAIEDKLMLLKTLVYMLFG